MNENKMWADGLPNINVAHYEYPIRTLGPGLRAAIWVQGCNLNCQGCVSKEWIPDIEATLITPEELAEKILNYPELTGITISGGEPMLQAGGLAKMIRIVRRKKDISVISYTGNTLEQLKQTPPTTGAKDFLSLIDVLIDGPFVNSLNDNYGLRGSSNQQINHLTDRHITYDFKGQPREVEIHIRDGQLIMAGVPPQNMHGFLEKTAEQVDGMHDKWRQK
jgi:anaerobic ribonucleoside-triphosphate reductase activating protein